MTVKPWYVGVGALALVFALMLVYSAGVERGLSVPEALRVVRVPVTQFVKLEPDTIIRWREKIVTVTVDREQRVQSDSAGIQRVTQFCEAAKAITDTVTVTHYVPQALGYAGSYDGKRLDLFSVVSDGSKVRDSYKVRTPIEWVMNGDSAIVRGARFWWLDDAIKAGAVFGGGFLLGTVWR